MMIIGGIVRTNNVSGTIQESIQVICNILIGCMSENWITKRNLIQLTFRHPHWMLDENIARMVFLPMP